MIFTNKEFWMNSSADNFQKSVAYTLRELETIRSYGHTRLRASVHSLAALTCGLKPTHVAGKSTPATVATSAQLRDHFARKNIETATSPPPSVTAPPTGDPAKSAALATLQSTVSACKKCPLLATARHQVVFGAGNSDADILFVGEAPEQADDQKGEPFMAPSGALLGKIINAMGLDRSQVFLTNVLKCRPDMPPQDTGNRSPSPQEMENCLPYLRQQIEIIQPKAVVALGSIAMEGLFGLKSSIYKMRGRWYQLKSIPVMATYHPSFLLAQSSNTSKRELWEDMLKVMKKTGLPISPKQQQFFHPNPSTTR